MDGIRVVFNGLAQRLPAKAMLANADPLLLLETRLPQPAAGGGGKEREVHLLRPGEHKWWVFAGGLTDVGVTNKATDTSSGAAKTYTSTKSRVFQTFADCLRLPVAGSGSEVEMASLPGS